MKYLTLILILSALLSCSTALARQSHGIVIPELSEWPTGKYPSPIDLMPNDPAPTNGVLLPQELAKGIDARLKECELLPKDFEKSIEDYQLLLTTEIDRKLSLERENVYKKAMREIAETYQFDEAWEPWKVGLVVVAGVTGGLLVGFLAGYAYAGASAQ